MNQRLYFIWGLLLLAGGATGCTDKFFFTELQKGKNLPPTAQDLLFVTEFNRSYAFEMNASHMGDPESPAKDLQMSVVEAQSAKGGTLTILSSSNGTHQLRYTPATGFRGTDTALYRVTDPQGASVEAKLTFLVESALRTVQPALAIRAVGCAMCHARVSGNMITDFGHGGDNNGLDYFLGGNLNPPPFAFNFGTPYGDHGYSLITTNLLNGTVYVPQANMPGAMTGLPQDFSLKTYMELAISLSPSVNSTRGTASVVAEANELYIGAPTAAQMLAPAGAFEAGARWKYIPHSSNSLLLSGLEVVQSAHGAYVRNIPNGLLTCEGDLVIDAPVLFDRLQLMTTNNGCRVYSTRTVFIQGAITHMGQSQDRNLQISSARAVSMGLGQGPVLLNGALRANSLVYRLQEFWTRSTYFTREPGTVQEKLDRIVEDSLCIDGLLDAELQPEGRDVAYDRLLLNAPVVLSRYVGDFTGTMIGEILLPSFGQFKYEFDPVLGRVPILPLVNESELLGFQ